MSNRRKVPGVAVYRRGKSWAYQVELDPDQLTGQRRRAYKGGFNTESDAWGEALEARRRRDSGRAAGPRKIRVHDFLHEWLVAVAPAIKPTTLANYRDNINSYVVPTVGQRWLGDITVQTLNALYRHLLAEGRRRGDENQRMYAYWLERRNERGGLGPLPREIAAHCATTLHAARRASARFRHGRSPRPRSPGLSPKSVRNVHRLLHRAFHDAVAWGYLFTNPAEHAVIPRAASRAHTPIEQPWTIEELATWLKVALQDRYAGMWILAATTGMRRSELAGLRRTALHLQENWLALEDTRIVVDGRVQESDGKSAAGWRQISLDAFTVKHLQQYLERLDGERQEFGGHYPKHGLLMVDPTGRPLHPDTITRRFNRLVDQAGVRRIRLHDVRHSYATMAMDAGADPKLLSDRIGHANTAVTLQIYTHRSRGRDRELADTMAQSIEAAINTLVSE